MRIKHHFNLISVYLSILGLNCQCSFFPFYSFYNFIYFKNQTSSQFCLSTYSNYSSCINPTFILYQFNHNKVFVRLQTKNSVIFSSLVPSILSYLSATQSQSDTIVENVLNNYNNSRNQCFSSVFNLINGLYCLFTSSATLNYRVVDDFLTPLKLAVDVHDTGKSLTACLNQVEFYCVMLFGRSIFSSTLPFGRLFDLSDLNMSVDVCTQLNAVINCTSFNRHYFNATTDCDLHLYQILVNNTFASNLLAFNPSFDFLTQLRQLVNNLITLDDFMLFRNATKNNTVTKGIGVYFRNVSDDPQINVIGSLSGAGQPIWFLEALKVESVVIHIILIISLI